MGRVLGRLLSFLMVCLMLVAVGTVVMREADPAMRAERMARERLRTQHAAERAEAMTAAVEALAVLLVVGAAGGVAVALALGGVAVVARLRRARAVYPDPSTALYPLLPAGGGGYVNPNEPRAQTLAALAAAAGRRPSAAVVGRVLEASPSEPPAAQIEAPRELTAAEVVEADLRTAPHWLLVGSTGSGKTVAAFYVLAELARRAACEFVLCEPAGANWGAQATATTTEEIAAAIIAERDEMMRRLALLRETDAEHVADLPEPLPYRVLVVEETETVLDDLRLTDRNLRTEAVVALRAIARLGRKAGVALVAVTQAGTTDVFDAHVRKNLSNVLLFRSEHTVGEMWRVRQRLADLRPGEAWSVRHGALVRFPRVSRPVLPPASPSSPLAVSVGVERLAPGREPGPEMAERLRQLYAEGWSKSALCRLAWGYKDGAVWDILDRVLSGQV